MYAIRSYYGFVVNYAGEGALPRIISAIELYRQANPGEAVEIFFLPETVRLLFRGMDYYDPGFGAGFYNGSWNEGFDHAETLSRITSYNVCYTKLLRTRQFHWTFKCGTACNNYRNYYSCPNQYFLTFHISPPDLQFFQSIQISEF